ncbi:NADH dehydrogenase [ubiquinone] 1 subunit C2 [Ixodes scapularis]|uniref:NADH:ubiquinone oxidoreductase, NDUFC2/B14.5B subunit, putative n=1 Tax=Ixodes scapularis TaxID=6945 RepID=B7P949_IXOSC|nr:NADH dehydrogenase [ubiquinone] 1 subunit C2 [Ixodes scapularis]EEC03121.1 NADH:ubiquinone oxidoreductase, NDUFC2/B14.5B subunit, putative [Ixodes scapularis]|eukprot:XP_002403590.1 NADH:ubiquinone oxidoreductase, NDUFC2/B14.5B subunit, putative [Ixodes scapularis]
MADDEFANADLTGRYGELPPYYANLFRPTRDEEHRSITTKLWYWGFPAFIGIGTICVVNLSTRRPALSGIQKHLIAASIGAVTGEGLRRYFMYSARERDALLRHYILLHPEDFPEPERKKYADVFEPWLPVR